MIPGKTLFQGPFGPLIDRNKPTSVAASIVFSGHNLALWTDYTGLDPEVSGYGNNQQRGGAAASQFVRVDAYSMPQTRRYSVQLNVTY